MPSLSVVAHILAASLAVGAHAAPTISGARRGLFDWFSSPITIPITGGTYDYVVIGGGTAGATIGARLAEDPSVTVAIIEAGDGLQDINPLVSIPGADVLGVGADPSDSQPNDWNFVTEPQAGAGSRRIHYARGKGLGGSSNRNFMLYQRPTSDSFDSWQVATSGQASPGWSWSDVYPYYTKSVTLSGSSSQRGPGQSASFNPAAYPETDRTKAPISLSFANFAFDYAVTLKKAFAELLYAPASDFNSGKLNGYEFATSTINGDDGKRSTSQAFIRNAQASGRTNLKVITSATVKKIHFDPKLNAVSVTYQAYLGLASITVGASKEVVLSAGAFQSPQVLMVSGIGPQAQLARFGIKTLVDLPGVGQGMQDHVFFSPGYQIDPSIYQLGKETQALGLLAAGGSFLFDQSGSLANPVCDLLGWQRLNSSFFSANPEASALASYPPLWPHIEFLAAPGLTSTFSNLFSMNSAEASANRFHYSLLGALVAPLSRGSVTLASADTKDKPLINPNWLTHKGDQAVAIEIYRKIRRLFNTAAFKAVRVNSNEYYPGYDKSSDASILRTIQSSVQTVWHAACTCAMQPRSQNGVLDPYLRVYGVQRLRVVDASSFPMLPPGHPQSTVYMLAERAADLMRVARGAGTTTTARSPPAGDAGSPYSGPN